MNIVEQRKVLQKTIENLPASQLMMVTEYAISLQSGGLAWEELPLVEDESLLHLIETIRQTPFNPDNVILPTKYMVTDAGELEDQRSNLSLNSSQWDNEWDQLEATLKTARLSHETLERELDW